MRSYAFHCTPEENGVPPYSMIGISDVDPITYLLRSIVVLVPLAGYRVINFRGRNTAGASQNHMRTCHPRFLLNPREDSKTHLSIVTVFRLRRSRRIPRRLSGSIGSLFCDDEQENRQTYYDRRYVRMQIKSSTHKQFVASLEISFPKHDRKAAAYQREVLMILVPSTQLHQQSEGTLCPAFPL